jgi:hypothetical protein
MRPFGQGSQNIIAGLTIGHRSGPYRGWTSRSPRVMRIWSTRWTIIRGAVKWPHRARVSGRRARSRVIVSSKQAGSRKVFNSGIPGKRQTEDRGFGKGELKNYQPAALGGAAGSLGLKPPDTSTLLLMATPVVGGQNITALFASARGIPALRAADQYGRALSFRRSRAARSFQPWLR